MLLQAKVQSTENVCCNSLSSAVFPVNSACRVYVPGLDACTIHVFSARPPGSISPHFTVSSCGDNVCASVTYSGNSTVALASFIAPPFSRPIMVNFKQYISFNTETLSVWDKQATVLPSPIGYIL